VGLALYFRLPVGLRRGFSSLPPLRDHVEEAHTCLESSGRPVPAFSWSTTFRFVPPLFGPYEFLRTETIDLPGPGQFPSPFSRAFSVFSLKASPRFPYAGLEVDLSPLVFIVFFFRHRVPARTLFQRTVFQGKFFSAYPRSLRFGPSQAPVINRALTTVFRRDSVCCRRSTLYLNDGNFFPLFPFFLSTLLPGVLAGTPMSLTAVPSSQRVFFRLRPVVSYFLTLPLPNCPPPQHGFRRCSGKKP